MKKFKEQAESEFKALAELGKCILNVQDVSPLTKSLLVREIVGFREILSESWNIHEVKDSNFFYITDEMLHSYDVQMQSLNGNWMRVGHRAFEKISHTMTIRLQRTDAQFFEANGQTEFLLTASPLLIKNEGEEDKWLVSYQG